MSLTNPHGDDLLLAPAVPPIDYNIAVNAA